MSNSIVEIGKVLLKFTDAKLYKLLGLILSSDNIVSFIELLDLIENHRNSEVNLELRCAGRSHFLDFIRDCGSEFHASMNLPNNMRNRYEFDSVFEQFLEFRKSKGQDFSILKSVVIATLIFKSNYCLIKSNEL